METTSSSPSGRSLAPVSGQRLLADFSPCPYAVRTVVDFTRATQSELSNDIGPRAAYYTDTGTDMVKICHGLLFWDVSTFLSYRHPPRDVQMTSGRGGEIHMSDHEITMSRCVNTQLSWDLRKTSNFFFTANWLSLRSQGIQWKKRTCYTRRT